MKATAPVKTPSPIRRISNPGGQADVATATADPAGADAQPAFKLRRQSGRPKRGTVREMAIQCGYVQWARRQSNVFRSLRLLHHCPNGEKRDVVIGAKLQRMGVLPGIPDVFLPAGRSGWHGLYIEFKTPEQFCTANHGLTEQQIVVHELFEREGFLVRTCCDAQVAIDLTRDYLAGQIVRESALAG